MVNKYLFLAVLATTVLSFAKSDDASDVISLTSTNFDEIVKSEKQILVEFFAPWCGHCKALAPEYEIAATTLKEKGIKLAKVDCTVETNVCSDYEVRGYPTLKVFHSGEPEDYKGPRKADGIVSYMIKQSLPALSEVTVSGFEAFTGSDRVVIVGFLSESENKEEYAALNSVASKLRQQYLFGVTSDEELAKKHGVTFPSIVLYKTFDEGKNELTGTLTEETLAEFVKTNSIPLLDEIGPENYAQYHESNLPLAYIFVDNEEDRTKLIKAIEPLARESKGKINFVHIDAEKYGGHGQNLALKQKWPAFAIQANDGGKYPFDQSKEITTESIGEFLTKFLTGEIEPSFKSEEIPEKNDEPVKIVVGLQFDEIVLDKEKDVLIEFYAPWCGHCKKLAPIWEELGAAIAADKANSNIVIAKMDGTENDLPKSVPFRIESFPTIKLFRAGDNEVIDYNGDRTFAGFAEFLKEHAVNKPVVEVPETVIVEEDDDDDDDVDDNDYDDEEEIAPEHDHDEL